MLPPHIPSIPARPKADLVNDQEWLDRSRTATIVVGSFTLPLHPLLEVALLELDDINNGSTEVFPPFFDKLWVAVARNPQTKVVLCAYEFFAGPTTVFPPAPPGARLEGKAIVVDLAHPREGLAAGLLTTLYANGVFIAPGPDSTAEGAALLNKLVADGIVVPASGAITDPWPP